MIKPLRVLHCPSMVGGNPQQLARAERQLGLDSTAVAFKPSYINYPSDEVLSRPGESPILLELRRCRLLFRAMRDFDLIHFNFGQTITPLHFLGRTSHSRLPRAVTYLYDLYTQLVSMRELPWLKRLGKGIVVTFQGDDARQGDYSIQHFPINMASEVEPGYYTPRSDAIKRQRIQRWERYADQIYALNPDLLHVLPAHAEFLPYATVDLADWRPVLTQESSHQPVRLLHAPSHRGAKGTRHILDAVKLLQDEDRLPVELVLLEGMSYAEVRKVYPTADLLVDQVLAGWYGGVAVELMALGKPVVCYIREDDLHFIPSAMAAQLPMIQVEPSTLYPVLKDLLANRHSQLPVLGLQSRRYVEAWHDPLKIAARLAVRYQEIMMGKA